MNLAAAPATADLQFRRAQRGALLLGMLLLVAANVALAQAQGSPFMTGANSLQTNILAWLTPIAVILVMVLGAMAMANRMDRPEGDQRLWFVIDELDALGQIDGLKDALARLRKFGGRCVLGFQSIAQVSSTYGHGEGQTLVENCGNTLVLRCSGSEHGGTSQFASRLIGEREVLRLSTSHSRRASELFASVTRAEHLSVESAVMAAQIEQLPDLAGYLKIASQPQWRRVVLRPITRNTKPAARERAATMPLSLPGPGHTPGVSATLTSESMEAGPGPS